jgi:hypothetical protein
MAETLTIYDPLSPGFPAKGQLDQRGWRRDPMTGLWLPKPDKGLVIVITE